MASVRRIEVDEARGHMASSGALLVCAYEDEDRCAQVKLPGSLSLHEFEARAPTLPKDREIVFYCA